jgi:hypothetical protein
MKTINRSRFYKSLLFGGLTVLAAACFPDSDSEDLGIGAIPDVSFTIEPIAGGINTYLVKASSPEFFSLKYDMLYEGDADAETIVKYRQTDTLFLPNKGEYTVTLLAAHKNGLAVAEKTVDVPQDACIGNIVKLTGCSSKTWVLDQPAGGALLVADPSFPANPWWSNTAADILTPQRACQFDDEYTFTSTGDFIFENHGTMRVDDEANAAWPTDIGLAIGCHDMSEIPDKYKAWGSGTHSFKINATSLTVKGLGAFLGLYKVGQTGTAATPESEVTFSIISLTENKMVIRKVYSWGGWQFTFKVKE